MKKTAGALALGLLLAGCGGESDNRARTLTPASSAHAGQPQSEKPAQVEGALTERQLKQALLAAPELPTGYSVAAASPDDDEDDNPPGAGAECDERFEKLDQVVDDATAEAEAEFTGPGLGTTLTQDLASYDDEDQIKDGLEQLAAVFDDCQSFTTTNEEGTKTTFDLAALSFPRYGDETLAYAVSGKSDGISIALNLVIVRTGQTLALISQGGLATDVAALETAVKNTLTKLKNASS